ncbi:hypothetical protein [Streptomyces sp. OR43]|uniref:hypothetical protein n=1 Tax=Streptomyces sp. or43 TaxID=2478957 RepID=UPI0021C6C161|nr:hypothetical protein [Streptomyces sp. or43]
MTDSRLRRSRTLLFLLPVLVLLGCDNRSPAARSAATAFERAWKAHDAEAVCAALAPGTRSELESDERAACPEALDGVSLPVGGKARTVDVHGRQARVVLAADTLFLSLFPGGWKVVAAGCSPRPDKPYSCELKGA